MIAKYYKTDRALTLAITLLAGLTLIAMTNSCRQQKQSYRGPRPNWTMDVKNAHSPNGPITGEINGRNFEYKRAVFHAGNIRFMSKYNDQYVLILGLGTNISHNSFDVDSNSSDFPQVEIAWRENGLNYTQSFTTGYSMKLKLDSAQERKCRGQIYLCLPDDSKSYIAGDFIADLPRPQSSTAATPQ